MPRTQRIGRISPGALNPPQQEQKNSFFGVARGEFPAPGAISLIRFIRGIRVEPLNLDASPTAIE